MRVGIVLGRHAEDEGGAFTLQLEIVRAVLASAENTRHKFELFVRDRSWRNLETESSAAGVPTRRYGLSLTGKITAVVRRTAPEVSRSLRTHIDRVADRYAVDFLWFLSPSAPETPDIPYLATVWDLQHRLQPWFPEVGARGEWERRERTLGVFLRRAALVLTGTAHGKEEIERFYGIPPERIVILPHPAPLLTLPSNDRQDPELLRKYSLDLPFLLYPALFWPHKNHVNLLHAVQTLRSEHGIDLDLILPGSDKGNLRYVKSVAVSLGLEKYVRFPGFVERDDLAGLYRRAVALVYVSFFGPENLPPLEAFALGCPVIASRVAGAEEQMGQAAMLVDPKKPREIAGAIKTLMTDPSLRDDLILRGKERAQRFSSADFVRSVYALLDEFEAVRRCWPSSALPGA
jgi:glycosyltransferase involved in cell wall biosynthesis